jgi:hypothetical protein
VHVSAGAQRAGIPARLPVEPARWRVRGLDALLAAQVS